VKRGRPQCARIVRENAIAIALSAVCPDLEHRNDVAARLANESTASVERDCASQQLRVTLSGLAGQENIDTYLRQRLAGTHGNVRHGQRPMCFEDWMGLGEPTVLVMGTLIAPSAALAEFVSGRLLARHGWPLTTVSKLRLFAGLIQATPEYFRPAHPHLLAMMHREESAWRNSDWW